MGMATRRFTSRHSALEYTYFVCCRCSKTTTASQGHHASLSVLAHIHWMNSQFVERVVSWADGVASRPQLPLIGPPPPRIGPQALS